MTLRESVSKPVPPRNWRYPVPARVAVLPEGEQVAEACRLASGGMPALQAAATCGLAWASDLLDEAVALGHAACLERFHAIRQCAGEAYRYYETRAWQATVEADARVATLPADWAQRAGRPLSFLWGYLGLVYRYEQAPVIMATLRPAFLATDANDLTGADPDAAALLEAPDEAEAPPRILQYTPVSLQDLRRRPEPDADLLPGLARARGFAFTGEYDCSGPLFGFESTGVKPPLAERGHESLTVRAAKRDGLSRTEHPKVGQALDWHTERIDLILAQFPAEWDDEPTDDERPGYPFWDGHHVNLAGVANDSLYEQWEPRLQRQPSPDVTKRQAIAQGQRAWTPDFGPLRHLEGFIRGPSLGRMRHALVDGRQKSERYHQFAKPTPLALWWLLRDGGPMDAFALDHSGLTPEARAFLLDVKQYWDGEPVDLSEVKPLVLRQARAAGVPEWPTPAAIKRAMVRADCYAEDFDVPAYRSWAIATITGYAKEQLAALPDADAALDRLYNHGPSGRRLDAAERARATAGQRAERPLLQRLFTPEPGRGRPLFIKGHEAWAKRPARSRRAAINGPAEVYGEDAALNQLDLFADAVRHGALGEHSNRLLTFAGTLRNFLDGALGNATTTGRATVTWLLQDGQPTTLLDLVRTERWRRWQTEQQPQRNAGGPDAALVRLYAYLADPRILYTELAPAVLWVHQVCFAGITAGRRAPGFRLYVTPASLASSRDKGFVTEAQVAELLAAGALGQLTDQAFRSYDADALPFCPDWVRRDWTPARLRDLARGSFAIAQAARDGRLVTPDAFAAMATAMGYPESAVARGLKRLGQGITVESVAGFGHLDATHRARESAQLEAHRHGLLGWAPDSAWTADMTFRDAVDALLDYAPAETTEGPATDLNVSTEVNAGTPGNDMTEEDMR